ncbi:hypothetical protein Tco_1232594 [Tanacetum coccineum]
MDLPDVDLPKYHLIKDAKGIWDAIKTRYGGNAASKKMQKSVLPSTWTNVYLIMRNKEGIDDMDIDDLYNTLKAHEGDVKGTTISSSSLLNMAFVSKEITSSTEELSTAYHVNSATGQSNKAHGSSSYVYEVMYSFFANQYSAPQLDHDDLEQVDRRKMQFDRKEPVGFDKTKVECFNCHKKTLFYLEKMITGSYKEEPTNYALMAITSSKYSSSASSDTEPLKKKKRFLRKKEDLKAKLKKFENSSKNLTKLLDSQISPKVKIGLGYGKEETVCDVSESDVSETVFDTSTSDKEKSQTYDRFKKVEGFHVVPHPLSGNFIPPKADLSFAVLDDSVYTSTAVTKYAPKSNEVSVETPKEVKSKGEYVRPVKHAKSVKIAKSVRPITPAEKPKESCSSPKNDSKECGKQEWVFGNWSKVSTAKPKQAVSTSVPRQVNTVRPKQSVNFPKNTFNRSHSPITRSYYAPSAQRRSLSPKRVNTVRQAVNTGKGNGITAVKPSAGCIWRPRPTETNQVSKDNKWICTMEHPHIALKDKGIADSGCSRHMTGTKEYLSDYQEIKGGFVAFGEGKGRITGKG